MRHNFGSAIPRSIRAGTGRRDHLEDVSAQRLLDSAIGEGVFQCSLVDRRRRVSRQTYIQQVPVIISIWH